MEENYTNHEIIEKLRKILYSNQYDVLSEKVIEDIMRQVSTELC